MFKPKILKKSKRQVAESRRDDGFEHKCFQLYDQASKKKTINKTDKDYDEILLEKNYEEYTFQPNSVKKRPETPPQEVEVEEEEEE